jgi:hypothetical protein
MASKLERPTSSTPLSSYASSQPRELAQVCWSEVDDMVADERSEFIRVVVF